MSGNNETDRSSGLGQVASERNPPTDHDRLQAAQANQVGNAQADRCMTARPMSDAQALPTRVAALMRAEAAVVQGAADLIGSAERNGMAVSVLVLGEGGAVLHQLGQPLPDGAWPPQDPESVALAALANVARDSATAANRVVAAQALLSHAASQPKLSDPDGIGAMLNGLGYPRHVNGERFTLAGRVRHALDLARANGADDERIRRQSEAPTIGGVGIAGEPVIAEYQHGLPFEAAHLAALYRQADNGALHYLVKDGSVHVFVGTAPEIRGALDGVQFGQDDSIELRELALALPGLTFAAQRHETVWIALESGRAFAFGTPAEIASMCGSEQQREIAATATAEVDAQAEVSITAELQVKKAQPRAPSHLVRADSYTSPFPHAFRRNRDSALCWAWLSPSRIGGTVCMVEHETGESTFINSAACLLTEYTQLTTG